MPANRFKTKEDAPSEKKAAKKTKGTKGRKSMNKKEKSEMRRGRGY